MNKKIKTIVILVCSFALIASVAFAGVLMAQWTEGTSRFCEYSDGEVIEINFGSTCSSTN